MILSNKRNEGSIKVSKEKGKEEEEEKKTSNFIFLKEFL